MIRPTCLPVAGSGSGCVWMTNTVTPPTKPMVCQRHSSEFGSNCEAACGSLNTRVAVSKLSLWFRLFARFFRQSQVHCMLWTCSYRRVATYPEEINAAHIAVFTRRGISTAWLPRRWPGAWRSLETAVRHRAARSAGIRNTFPQGGEIGYIAICARICAISRAVRATFAMN